MKYEEVLELLKSNSSLDIVRRMRSIGLDPSSALAGGDWRNCDFSNLDLRNFDMRNADFRGAGFAGADVNHADFRGSSIDENLSVAKNFNNVTIDYDSKVRIDKTRKSLANPISYIYEGENFIDEYTYEKITKDAVIKFRKIGGKQFSKYGITYKRISLSNFIVISIFIFMNENFPAKEAKLLVSQFLRLYRKYRGGKAKINCIALIEASKYVTYSQFLDYIWPMLKMSTGFYKQSPLAWQKINYLYTEESKIAFEICKMSHKKESSR